MKAADLGDLYRDHVERLSRETAECLEHETLDTLVIDAGVPGLQSRFDDQYWPHQATPAFAHWLPLSIPGCALVVRAGEKPVLIRPNEASYWEGAPPSDGEHFIDCFDVKDAATDEIAGLLGANGRSAWVGNDSARGQAWGFEGDAINPSGLVKRLDAVRAVKSDYERWCIGEANRRGAKGHHAAFEAFARSDRSELELHLLYLGETNQDDLDTPYKNIFALGEHAAVLHHVHYGRERSTGPQSLLIDAGATCFGYAADITRTEVKLSDSDADAALFAELIMRMESLQQTICKRIEAGISFEVLHDFTHENLAPILIDLGIAKSSVDELVGGGVTRVFLPHGLGHSLGIQVHDVGCRMKPPAERNPYLRNTADVEVGQVFTIEPGCYFIPALLDELRAGPQADSLDWPTVDRLRRFGGVRIEDNIAVVDDGTVNLTRDNWPTSD
jgi:Xaa-Pro dipeptidase